MNSQSMCKFILDSADGRLQLANFVYEATLPHAGEMQLLRSHTMYLVTQGAGEYRGEFLVRRLRPGTLFFSFAGAPSQINDAGGLQYMYITFTGERAEELFRRFGISQSNCVFEGFEQLAPLWKDSLTRAGGENIDLLSESMLLYAFSKLRDSVNPCHRVLNQMLKTTEEHFTNSAFSLAFLAGQLGYNAKYLSHLFKEEMGMAFSEYLTNLRMKHAVFLMAQGVTAAKNVALLSGYADPLYFSKVFKKYMGTSPRDYLLELQQPGGQKREAPAGRLPLRVEAAAAAAGAAEPAGPGEEEKPPREMRQQEREEDLLQACLALLAAKSEEQRRRWHRLLLDEETPE